ncbi:MAG: sensor histidine kinase [Gemmatimonadota bacterium]
MVLTVGLSVVMVLILFWALSSVQRERTRAAVGWGRRVLEAQEEERRSIARELHDGFVPSIDSLSIELRRMGGTASSERATALAQQLRTLSRGLHPGVLDHLPIADALEQLCSSESTDGFVVTLDVDELPPLDFPHRLACYRITQEAINNARRHAGASRIEVLVDEINGTIDLTIRDNGRGFVVPPDSKLASLGLRSMRERASALGGTLTITSALQDGTTVHARLPTSSPG